MSKLVITTASNSAALANLDHSVINGVPLASIASHPAVAALLPTIRARSVDGRVRMWGSVAGSNSRHQATWNRIEPGDWIAVSTDGRFNLAARVYALLDSSELADSVWDAHEESGSYRYMTFFDSLTTISVTSSAMSSALGYLPRFIYRGFLVPSEDAQNHLSAAFGSVPEFLGVLSDELQAATLLAADAITPSAYLDALGAADTDEAEGRIEAIVREHANALPPDVIEARIRRLRRDTTLVRKLKDLYQGRCQRCEFTFMTRSGKPYAEAAHITPLAEQLPGIDSPGNIVILCANCHRILDHGNLQIYWDENTGKAVAALDGIVQPLRRNLHIHAAWQPANEWEAATEQTSDQPA